MDDGPANGTRPDITFAGNVIGADSAFVVPVANVLLDPLPKVGGSRLRNVLLWPPLFPIRPRSTSLRARLGRRLRLSRAWFRSTEMVSIRGRVVLRLSKAYLRAATGCPGTNSGASALND